MEPKKSWLDSALSVFSDVRAGEGRGVLMMTMNLFVALVAYYVIKTVREPLILASGGAELKSYASAVQAVVLIGAVPAYSWFVSHTPRKTLVRGVLIFFILNIEGFWLAARMGAPFIGFLFYVWVGIFSLAVIAQFWSYANDIYSRGAGERLFPVIAVGATLGSMGGSKVAAWLFAAGFDAFSLLHVAAALLVVHLVLYALLEEKCACDGPTPEGDAPVSEGSGFALVLRSPYIRLIAALLIVLNIVNTTGEYILSSSVVHAFEAASALDPSLDKGAFIGAFYGDFFFVVNGVTVLVQALLVSRLVKYLGIGGVLFALPIVALGAYSMVAAGAGFAALRWAKTAENSTDYSVMNTAKAMLWLPTTRDEKYKAKQAIDTFFVRLGDVFAALGVFVGTTWFGLGARGFAVANLALIALWVFLAFRLRARYLAASSA